MNGVDTGKTGVVKSHTRVSPRDVLGAWKEFIVGQDEALGEMIPHVKVALCGLNPANRPAGVFLLLGPTGVGKTRSVEALAEVLHGDAKKVLVVNCAEFGQNHETARLKGAPPGYLGHRETQAVFYPAEGMFVDLRFV